MNTIFVLPSLKSGGSERVFSEIVKNWGDDRCRLIVLGNVTERDIKAKGLQKKQVISLNKERSIKAIYALYLKLREVKPDVIISTMTHINIILLMISFFYKAKYLIRESSVFTRAAKFSKNSFFLLFLLKLLYPRAEKIICQSEDIKQDLFKLLNVEKNTFVTINNPVDFTGLPLKKNEKKSTLRLIKVARFRIEKGHHRLIKILQNINRPYKMILVGSGPMLESFICEVENNELSENVVILGEVTPPYKELAKSDLFIQTSFVEGFPNALLEACAIGLPAIAYDVPGGTKEIINNNNGILIKEGEFKEFASQIDAFSSDQFNPDIIRNDIYRRFNSEKIIKQYQKLVLG